MKTIYLDHAATTPICEAAKRAIIDRLDDFGNPSSSHELGHKALMLIEDARERIAKCINAEPDEIYFTSGGSEANTWALTNKACIISSIEHHSIEPPEDWWSFDVNAFGIATIDKIGSLIKMYNHEYITAVSCMAVNNEIGTIQPIKEIAKIAHSEHAYFHTDAVQAVGHIPIDVKDIDCDMLSASGHKFGAPKGIGFLYIKKGTLLWPLINGGKQEQGMRGGTENVIGIIAMAAALEDAVAHMEEHNKHIRSMRDKLMLCLLQDDGIIINGSISYKERVDSNLNVQIKGVKGQDVVAMADQYGICISAGSACNEGNAEPSHVLKAIGLSNEEALSSIRITLGHDNTFEEIDYCCDMLPKIIKRLREIS